MTPLSFNAPRETAKRWLDSLAPTVVWQDTFYRYGDGVYHPLTDRAVRAQLDDWLEGQKMWIQTSKGPVAGGYSVRRENTSEILDMARNLAFVEGSELPIWIDGKGGTDLICLEDGLLHVPSMALLPHTPKLFNLIKLPFGRGDLEAAGPPPPTEWLRLLQTDWGEREIATLQEFFGYCLASHRRYQKFLMVIGPRRSGKGVILSVLASLLGEGNSYSAKLATFGNGHMDDEVGTTQLILIPDARKGLSRGEGSTAILEFLLTFTGNDPINFPRKYKTNWRGKPRAKLVIAANEIPGFQDSSSALAARVILLRRTRSFAGAEDFGLEERIRGELRSIFLWSLEGLRRLEARGRFQDEGQSSSAREEFEHLLNPVAHFLSDRCEFDAAKYVTKDGLYEEWSKWCRTTGTINNLRQIQVTSAILQQNPSVVAEVREGYQILAGVGLR